MTQRISAPGVGLPLPQNTYPTALQNAPYDLGTNQITLAAGDAINVPAGEWFVGLGMYLVLQFLDPITGTSGTVLPHFNFNLTFPFSAQ